MIKKDVGTEYSMVGGDGIGLVIWGHITSSRYVGDRRVSILTGHRPELHPTIKTQAPITYYWMKIIRCNWYENYSKKLCDHESSIGLTN